MAWKFLWYSARVEAAVESWPAGVRARFLRIIQLMRSHGPHIGMPHTKPMGAGLFEIRAKGREGIGWAFYCTMVGERIVILHAIIKKSAKTPLRDLELARTRQREVQP